MTKTEQHRPKFHFTPPQGWMNDPNGLVYFQGEYHLFYQHNPGDDVWGPMHWGHAVSPDLVNWEALPIALYPDENGTIFSGCAVVDWENTAGFGKESLIALFTHHHADGQRQSIAYSTDRGRTWTKYSENPVLTSPDGRRNFRDPKVFWFDTPSGGHWSMALAAGHEILFYRSTNLIQWEPSGNFGADHNTQEGIWETPDLFEFPLPGSQETRWVLTAGTLEDPPVSGRPSMRYFVGRFDGKTFTTSDPKGSVHWVDYGPDFYAAQSWSGPPESRKIWIGWLSNWLYANDIPAHGWRGALSVPRELSLVDKPGGPRLVQRPAPEILALRSARHTWTPREIAADKPLILEEDSGSYEIALEFAPGAGPAPDRFGVHLYTGPKEKTSLGFLPATGRFFLNRKNSGQTDFNPDFGANYTAEISESPLDIIDFQIFIDRTTIEVFTLSGQIVFSALIFPSSYKTRIEVFSETRPVYLNALEIYTVGG